MPDHPFSSDEIKKLTGRFDQMRRGMEMFKPEEYLPRLVDEDKLMPQFRWAISELYGDHASLDAVAKDPAALQAVWNNMKASFPQLANAGTLSEINVSTMQYQWDEAVKAYNFEAVYQTPYSRENNLLLGYSELGHIWQAENPTKEFTLKNYLDTEWERAHAASVPGQASQVSSFCPEGMITAGVRAKDGSYVTGCTFDDTPITLKESDVVCGVNDVGAIVFHDGREECPQGMTKLPNSAISKRGNSR